jgi:nucleotide-binding universal stress UspA family protein
MQMFKKILVAVDGSEASFNALERSLALSEKFDAELVILSAFQRRTLPLLIPDEDDEDWSIDVDVYEKYWASIRESHINVLKRAEEIVKERFPSVKYSTVLTEGRPSSEVISAAQKADVDLIVLGGSGRGGVVEWFLGSTSRKVVDSCDRSVLIVKN